MRSRAAQLMATRPVTAVLAAAVLLGALVAVAPVLSRPSLLLASTAMLLTLVAVWVWFARESVSVDWTTTAGAEARPRGHDHRVTSLARTIDSAIAGDPEAVSDLQVTMQSVAGSRLVRSGASPMASAQWEGLEGLEGLADHHDAVLAALGPDLTAYLTSPTPRHVSASELTSFISTLEEHE